MVPFDARQARRDDRVRRRPELSALERLEDRDLMAYSPLGFSLPDLTVSGYAAPVAAYGGQLAVTVDVSNIGSSTIPEGFNLSQGAPSSADAGASQVTVYVSRRQRFGPGDVKIGTIDIPAIAQNSIVEQTATLNMPNRPRGFPGNGGTIYVHFAVNVNHQVEESDRTNNIMVKGSPVQLAVNLPDLYGVALDVPPVMQPGDTIQPNIKIANFGTANPSAQGPFEVDLVASTTTSFGPGSVVLSRFTLDGLPPLSTVPSRNAVLGDVNIQEPNNIVTLSGPNVTLPAGPGGYFVGVIVDPQNKIREIHEIGRGPSSTLSPVRQVGAPIAGLSPAGVVSSPSPTTDVFPIPAFGLLSTGANPNPTGLGTGQAGTITGSGQINDPLTQAALAAVTGRKRGGGKLIDPYTGNYRVPTSG